MDETPNIWTEGDEILEENLPQQTEKENQVPSLTKEEQTSIIETSQINDDHKGLLKSLTEMNEVAKVLANLRDTETQEQRKSIIRAWSESFLEKRLQNNRIAEDLKQAVLHKLLINIDSIDLETALAIFRDIQDVTSVDATNALSSIMGSSGDSTNSQKGFTFNFNNNIANGQGSTASSNTMSVGSGAPANLKEVAKMSQNLSELYNVKMPRKEKNVTSEEN